MIRVHLPAHLRELAGVPSSEVSLCVDGDVVTQRTVLDALEAAYPQLRGTVRDQATGKRRPYVRFFVGETDRSHDDPDDPLPPAVCDGSEVFHVIGAIAGG